MDRPFKNNPKNLDPSSKTGIDSKTGLDSCNCFGMVTSFYNRIKLIYTSSIFIHIYKAELAVYKKLIISIKYRNNRS